MAGRIQVANETMPVSEIRRVLEAFCRDARIARDTADDDAERECDEHSMHCARSIAKRLGISLDV